ncbi:Protein kinase domain,Protein kinase-like domain,Serine/threonine-protein kinase, active [Cinara cedri]|uniref:Protein kinase domain,Protein kinase-like domain,Serine/threonine-protein kinase, active n=1 Tax=Cinara cedri TaxID=506608 RepID=A0A5E4M6M2_9HEMI|nr:Protein kinase domain,Protein kinase-like domain,Serine/threonine-protein kinase, active [Cinara cedri]
MYGNNNNNNKKVTVKACNKNKKDSRDTDNNWYKPIEIIGQGSYGTVMKCLDKRTDEIVAIKKITESIVNQPDALREFIILGRLKKHDHVISLLNIFRKKTFFYIVFPYVQYNMFDYMIEFYPDGFGYLMTKEFMIQLIRGVDYIHEKSVVHRDLKPQNILVTGDGVVKICDMGISRIICPPSFNADLTVTPEMGTIWYQAPEVLIGLQNYGTEVDIWSIGMIFIEWMIGDPFIKKNTAMKQYKSIIKQFSISTRDQKFMNEKLKEINRVYSINYITTRISENTVEALTRHYPNWPIDLIEIVSKCVQFKPSKRKTTKTLLNESYFVNGNFLKVFSYELKNKLK